ncbi:esterase [Raoultella ornithinolytica]|nr:esterase [Raoultella ornithinolytica]
MQYKLAPDVPQVDGVGHEQRRAILVSAQADPLNPNSVNRASDSLEPLFAAGAQSGALLHAAA